MVFFGTSFGLLHKNQKKGKRRLGEGQKKSIFYSSNDDTETNEILVSYSSHKASIPLLCFIHILSIQEAVISRESLVGTAIGGERFLNRVF